MIERSFVMFWIFEIDWRQSNLGIRNVKNIVFESKISFEYSKERKKIIFCFLCRSYVFLVQNFGAELEIQKKQHGKMSSKTSLQSKNKRQAINSLRQEDNRLDLKRGKTSQLLKQEPRRKNTKLSPLAP